MNGEWMLTGLLKIYKSKKMIMNNLTTPEKMAPPENKLIKIIELIENEFKIKKHQHDFYHKHKFNFYSNGKYYEPSYETWIKLSGIYCDFETCEEIKSIYMNNGWTVVTYDYNRDILSTIFKFYK